MDEEGCAITGRRCPDAAAAGVDDAAGSLASYQGPRIDAGAEVQQPLATVVIGGIISSPVAPGVLMPGRTRAPVRHRPSLGSAFKIGRIET